MEIPVFYGIKEAWKTDWIKFKQSLVIPVQTALKLQIFNPASNYPTQKSNVLKLFAYQ